MVALLPTVTHTLGCYLEVAGVFPTSRCPDFGSKRIDRIIEVDLKRDELFSHSAVLGVRYHKYNAGRIIYHHSNSNLR
jgi:hypothetical protein